MGAKQLAGGLCLAWVLAASSAAHADKSAVTLSGPQTAARGQEITVQVSVTHSANTSAHHTQWLKVWVNGKETAHFAFGGGKLPEGAAFAREVKLTPTGDVEVKAEASCNVHGSKGPGLLKISVK
jgi:desulfoferrodoxin (superoxide reductase-like protein)